MSPLTIPIKHFTGRASNVIKQEKKAEGIEVGKEEIQLFLYTDGMIVYIENPKIKYWHSSDY